MIGYKNLFSKILLKKTMPNELRRALSFALSKRPYELSFWVSERAKHSLLSEVRKISRLPPPPPPRPPLEQVLHLASFVPPNSRRASWSDNFALQDELMVTKLITDRLIFHKLIARLPDNVHLPTVSEQPWCGCKSEEAKANSHRMA